MLELTRVRTALIRRTQHGGFLSVVELLLQKGARVDGIGSGHEIGTPLHAAASGGHDPVLSLLLSRKADTESTDLGSATALHLAAASGHLSTVQLLLLAGAKHNARVDGSGHTPLDWAQKGQHEVIKVGNKARSKSTEYSHVIRLLKHPHDAKTLPCLEMCTPPRLAGLETEASGAGYRAEVARAWREVSESVRFTYGYRLLAWIVGTVGSLRMLLYVGVVVLPPVVVGVAMLQLPDSEVTAHSMSGLNAGIVRATEVDRDGQPTRIALGIEGVPTDHKLSDLPWLGELLPSVGVGDVAALMVYARYTLFLMATAVSDR